MLITNLAILRFAEICPEIPHIIVPMGSRVDDLADGRVRQTERSALSQLVALAVCDDPVERSRESRRIILQAEKNPGWSRYEGRGPPAQVELKTAADERDWVILLG